MKKNTHTVRVCTNTCNYKTKNIQQYIDITCMNLIEYVVVSQVTLKSSKSLINKPSNEAPDICSNKPSNQASNKPSNYNKPSNFSSNIHHPNMNKTSTDDTSLWLRPRSPCSSPRPTSPLSCRPRARETGRP